MPQFELALLSFGKLIGLMDDSGVVSWVWFANPFTNSMTGIPANREHFGGLLRALLDRGEGSSPYFDDSDPQKKLQWESLPASPPAQFGFVWNEQQPDLELGLGGLGTIPISSQTLNLRVLAQMLKFSAGGNVSSNLGKLAFSAGFPVPDFLTSASASGNYDGSFTFGLTAADSNGSKTLSFPTGKLEWDFPRLALFVLHAWVAKQADGAPPKSFFRRLNDHLYPMLGSPSGAIDPFPLVADAMGTDPDFNPWKDSILTSDDNAAGALTFLWHLRAIITGNEDPNIFGGSSWFRLVDGPALGAGEPPSFPQAGAYPPVPDSLSAWIGAQEVPNSNPAEYELVLDLRSGDPQAVFSIPLLRLNGGGLHVRPTVAQGTVGDLTTFLQGIPAINVGTGDIQFDPGTGRLTLTSHQVNGSGVPVLDGTYSLDLVLRDGQALSFRVSAPLLGMELPPNLTADDPKILLKNLLQWAISEVTDQNAGSMGTLAHDLVDLLCDLVETGTVDETLLFAAVASAMSEVAGTIEFGPISVGVTGTALTPALEIGPIEPDRLKNQSIDYYIGKVTLSSTLDLGDPGNPLKAIGLSIYDVRLGTGGGTTGSGLIAGLIPDMRDMQGFLLSVAWQSPSTLTVTGGGKVPIQKTIGPLEVVALLIDIRTNSLSVGIDLAFQLAMIKVAVYELGIRFRFDNQPPELFLHGLALSFEGGGITLAGMFLEVKKQNAPSDYVGGAVVKVVNLFELSAIGAYTEVDGEASLFIFASLVAPLGGPPWFFVTGVAGGFGFNRTLPPAGMVTDHPFIKVMRGEIPIGQGAESVAQISALFAAQKGSYWIAAGIQFTSFGFINGKVIVAVGFGNKFTFSLLGLASFGIKPIAYFELGIEVTADEEHFLLKAGLSPNSYIIHPDIFSLRGDFGLGVWYASPNAGDFILSIGGYHPYFTPPEHYPELSRVGVKCIVYGFIRMSVECFFACTPQALMAGASVTLCAEFAGIGCGLDVYIDVFIRYDPFFLQATMAVCLWFEFMGRHEIGVDLKIHTPPLGGTATIDLLLISFDVDFGSGLAKPPAPRIDQFITKQLGTPADRDGSKAVVRAFNADDAAGLFRFDLLRGRTTKPQSTSAKQEGIGTPLPVNAEFAFSVKTKIPVNESNPNSPVGASLTGEVDLALCDLPDLDTTLTVSGPKINLSQRQRLANYFPTSLFGEPLSAAQADDSGARQAVAKMASGDPAIALTEGIAFDYVAPLTPFPATPLVGLAEEDSLANEEYPLPLGWPNQTPQPWRVAKSTTVFKNVPFTIQIKPKVPKKSLQEAALYDVQTRAMPPLILWQYGGDLQRYTVGAQFKLLSFGIAQPAGVRGKTGIAATTEFPVINVPSSPLRRAELFGISLRVVPPKTPITVQKGRLETLSRARKFSKRMLSEGVRGRFAATAEVYTGKAVTLALSGGRGMRQTLTLDGQQTVRVIFQGGGEDFLMEGYVEGPAKIAAPRRSRRVTLIGEGMYPPVRGMEGTRGSTAIFENLGVEHDSTLLALGRKCFAGHGCVFVANTALPFATKLMDSVPGFEVLRASTNFTVYWPAKSKGGCLVMVVEPLGANPGLAVEQIRWAALGAELSGLSTIIGPAATALVMDLSAPNAWQLEIDLGTKWRLAGVVLASGTSRNMTNRLKGQSNWDLVDDRLQAGPEPLLTKAVLEVTQ